MSYARYDDNFSDDPRVVAAGDAMALHLVARCWIAKHGTDGFVPDHMLPRLSQCSNSHAIVLASEAVQLWARVEGGYRDVTYLESNLSAKELKKQRNATRRRVASFRKRKQNVTGYVTRYKRVCTGQDRTGDLGGSGGIMKGPVGRTGALDRIKAAEASIGVVDRLPVRRVTG